MRFLKLLLCASAIIFIIVRTLHAHENPAGENSSGTVNSLYIIEPLHYTIILMPNDTNRIFAFQGECMISIKIRYPTYTIKLHSVGLSIHEEETSLLSHDDIKYIPILQHPIENAIMLIFDTQLPPGLYTLHIIYFNYPSQYQRIDSYRILYTYEGYRVWLATKPFMTVAVQKYDHCFDDPILRPTYNISVKHPQNFTALSNMPIREKNMDDYDMMWSHFQTTPQMSSCAVVVVVFNFERIPNANETVNMWCRSNFTSRVQFAQNVLEKVAQHMIRYTTISEKIPKTDHILIPNFPLRSFSCWGLIIYKEERFINFIDTYGITRKKHMADIVAHEMIHQWFGNLVSASSNSDSWLSEGFASFLQAYFLNKMFQSWRTMDFFVTQNLHRALKRDTNSMINTIIYRPGFKESLEDSSPFYKAPVILRMLQHIIKKKVFQQGVIRYLTIHQFKSATTEDLWAAMQTALDESNVPYRDFKIKEVMDPWINQMNYPLVTVTRNYKTGEVIISQKDFIPEIYNITKSGIITKHFKWWIPITYTTQTNPDFTYTSLNFRWLSPKDENISFVINPNDWIILNLQQTGYYRVNYDTTNWQKIVDYLNSDEYTKIHVLNRAQLIDDAFNLVMGAQLEGSIFWNLTNYLSRETDFVAWDSMFSLLSRISEELLSTESTESEIVKSRLAGIFNTILKDIGTDENPNEDDIMALKRLSILKWACCLNNTICKRMANDKLNKHLSNPDSYISPSLYNWTYCNGLTVANMITWNKVMKIYAEKLDRNLLEHLACSEDPNIIIHYLNIMSSNNSIIQEAEHTFIFKFIIKRNMRNNLIFDYILGNLGSIKPKSMTTDYTLKYIISNIVSEEQLDKVQKYVKNNINGESSEIQEDIIICYNELRSNVDIYSKQFISNRN